jgi:UTP:GlnB (protein PII) uridylyltransferase
VIPESGTIEQARNYSRSKIEDLRAKIATRIANTDVSICAVGSFGRQEASSLSDLDFFLLRDTTQDDCEKELQELRGLLLEEGIKMPSKDGAFNSHCAFRPWRTLGPVMADSVGA